MAAILAPAEQRIILRNVSWETYEALLRDHEQSNSPRFTYDRGVLEIMSPFSEHEAYCRFTDCLLTVGADETNATVRVTGGTTYRREDIQRGFEPDASFYIQNEIRVRGKRRLDLAIDPPPDLVVEIDITHSSINKLAIYAQVGVPEVWRYDGARVQLLVLQGDEYLASPGSRVMPPMTVEALAALLDGAAEQDAVTWLRRSRAWARGLSA